MPILNTRGAASANGFGFGTAAGGAGYKYLMLYGTGFNIYYSDTTIGAIVPGTTPFINTGTSYWQGGSPQTIAGVAASGLTIVAGGGRSTNNGATWITYAPIVNWPALYQDVRLAGGANGSVALDPISKVGATAYKSYDGKSGLWANTIVTNVSSRTYVSSNLFPTCITWWPLAGRFFTPFYNSVAVNSITTGSSGAAYSLPTSNGAQPWCYADDGALYWSTWGGPNGSVYKTTDTSLSSTGTFVGNDYYANYIDQTVPVKGSGSNWYKIIRYNNVFGFLSNGGSGHPTFGSSFTTYMPNPYGGIAQQHPSLYYEADTGRLWANLLYYVGGSYPFYIWNTFYSTDQGGSWTWVTSLNSTLCFTKNTSYA